MGHLVGGISSSARALPDFRGEKFFTKQSKGAFIWDRQDRRYVDTAMGFGATVLGHANEAVLDAVKVALDHGPMPAFAHALEEEAAAAITRHCGALSKLVFVNTGSEAVHLACRAARAFTGRSTIVKFAAGYDGWYDDVAYGNAASPEARMDSNQRPARDGVALLRYNDKADADLLFAENPDIAAVVIEPVLANAGTVVPEQGYLEYLVQVARAHGALIISDEVLMGFRLKKGLSSDLLGFEPDLATLGKAIGSGFVVAAVVGTPEVMQVFEDMRANRAGTYNGNPVACAAVCATMKQFESVDYEALLKRGDDLRKYIEESFASVGLPVSTTGYGTVFTLWKTATPPTTYAEAVAVANPDFTMEMHHLLRAGHVLSMPLTYGRHYLSFAHNDEAIDILKAAFKEAANSISK